MTRINITTDAEDDFGNPATRLVGWFDIAKAEEFKEDREAYDGANLAGVHLRDQNAGQVLYLTAGGRWVLHGWSAWQGTVDTWEFIGADAARDWLLINGDDEAIERIFGAPVEPERGPGRPEIGPMVEVRMPADMIAYLDAWTEAAGTSRAAVLRIIVGDRMAQRD